MKKRYRCTFAGQLLVVIVHFSLIYYVRAAECNTAEFQNKLAKCPEIDLTSMTWMKFLGPYCPNIECSLACLESATEGDCDPPGTFRTVDTESYRVLARYICTDPAVVKQAIIDCDSSGWAHSCFANMQATFANLTLPADNYVAGYCSGIRTYRTCVDSTPLVPIDNCSPTKASYINTIMDLVTSAVPCNIQHENRLFNVLGGKSQCTSSSQSLTATLTFLFPLPFVVLIQLTRMQI